MCCVRLSYWIKSTYLLTYLSNNGDSWHVAVLGKLFTYHGSAYVNSAFYPSGVGKWGRQRRVWLIQFVDKGLGVQVKLWNSLTTRVLSEYFCSEVPSLTGAMYQMYDIYLLCLFFLALYARAICFSCHMSVPVKSKCLHYTHKTLLTQHNVTRTLFADTRLSCRTFVPVYTKIHVPGCCWSFQALMALFVLASKDGWVNIMYTGLDAVGVDMQVNKLTYSLFLSRPILLSFSKLLFN